LVHTRNEAKRVLLASGAAKTEAKRGSNLKKKKKYIWPRVQRKPKPKEAYMASGVVKTEAKRLGLMALGSTEPRQNEALWLRFLTEAKSLAPICFGSRTDAEYKKQPLPKPLPALVSVLLGCDEGLL